MKLIAVKSGLLVAAGFAIGTLTWNLPHALAAESQRDPSTMHYIVSIDEVKTNFAYGKLFRDHFAQTIILSDGTTHEIELTPALYEGKQVIEYKDNGKVSYQGLNWTSREGALVVQVRNQEHARDEMIAEGWRDADDKKGTASSR